MNVGAERCMYSSRTDMWETPQSLFAELNAEFGFELDVCATPENAKCARYYTPEMDGLSQPWAGVVWCNPPYGRQIGLWVAKAAESAAHGATVVMLLPARTDTRWFHQYIYGAAEIRFIRGRLKFGDGKNSAPFPSMLCVFGGQIDELLDAACTFCKGSGVGCWENDLSNGNKCATFKWRGPQGAGEE